MNADAPGGARTSVRLDTLALLRWWAVLLDSRFRIPGTTVRFGIDPLLALIPGFGDLASPAFAVALLAQGLHQRVPYVVLIRMLLNAFFDALLGAVPLAGPVADIFFRANLLNLALLERHARPGLPPRRADFVFVFMVAGLFGVMALIPVVMGLWLVGLLLRWAS